MYPITTSTPLDCIIVNLLYYYNIKKAFWYYFIFWIQKNVKISVGNHTFFTYMGLSNRYYHITMGAFDQIIISKETALYYTASVYTFDWSGNVMWEDTGLFRCNVSLLIFEGYTHCFHGYGKKMVTSQIYFYILSNIKYSAWLLICSNMSRYPRLVVICG